MDWLSGTFPAGTGPEEVTALFPGDWQARPRGGMGYRQSWSCGDLVLYFEGAPDMGPHLVASGKACRQVEAQWGQSWPKLFKVLELVDFKATRLDVALDDHAGVLDMATVVAHAEAGDFSGRSRAARLWRGIKRKSGQWQSTGCTVYFGAQSSRVQVRIYDKALERGVAGQWVRVEVQLRDERAQRVVELLREQDGIAEPIVGIVRNYVTFRERGAHADRSRWRECAWWSRFLGAAERVHLSTLPAARSLDQVKEWIRRQAAPSLALVLADAGGDLDTLVELCANGEQRWRDRHRLMLAS